MHDPSAGKAIRPLDANERRVLGTLIEKAKTTPDQYPLSLNALVTGCNQKSNRDPLMTLDEEQAMRAIEGLRASGAAAEVFGSGKIPRYRHLAYEWLGVEKEQLAIMGELLLRGEQSEGDLRGRASRMDPIPDLDLLRAHLDSLAAKGLVVWLSPPGRGRMLTHGLLPPEKLEKVRSQIGTADQPTATAETVSTETRPTAEKPRPSAEHSLEARLAAVERQLAEVVARLADLEQESHS
jgi:uncharacterized protein YceH (UPF0502 family)